MKKLIAVFAVLLIGHIAFGQEETLTTGPNIKFTEKVHQFGVITQGDTVEHTFIFENIGTEPLKILGARGSCGCTVPKYSREPIAPGAKGEVFVRFRSAGKRGKQNKTVTLTTNALNAKQVVLSIRGTVELPKSNGQ